MSPTTVSAALSSINELAKTGIVYYFIYSLTKYLTESLRVKGPIFVPKAPEETNDHETI